MKNPIDRRSFLKIGAVTGIASGLPLNGTIAANSTATAPAAEASNNTGIKTYVRLGRTELRISDISFGSSQLNPGEEYLVEHALARGVNYFDTAESYSKQQSEIVLGNALKGKRDQVYIATKMHAGDLTKQNTMMQSLEESLVRLQTDHVEIFFNHAVNDISRLQNEQWFEFAAKAKAQGKISYTGISGHAGNLVECCDYALDNDLVDVLLLGHNFGQDPSFYERFVKSFDWVANQPELPRIMAKAKTKDVGVIAMKVLRGARLNDMRVFEKDGATYSQAAFKWALSNDNVDATIISMTSKDKIDEFVAASGERQITDADFKLLEQYARNTDMTYCRHACNDCEGACPYNVPIADVLRTRMYATDYGNLEFAQTEYAALEDSASACLSCDGAPCRDACTHGINIAQLCGPTHLMLS